MCDATLNDVRDGWHSFDMAQQFAPYLCHANKWWRAPDGTEYCAECHPEPWAEQRANSKSAILTTLRNPPS